MGGVYNSVMNWGQQDPEQEQRELNQRYAQIRTANQNIQGILQRRLVYMQPNMNLENRINPQRVPHSKLKVKHISFSIQKHGVKISNDFKEISFKCDINKYQLLSNKYKFFVKIEIASFKKSKKQEPEEEWQGIFKKVFENCGDEDADIANASLNQSQMVIDQWCQEKGKD